MKTNELKKGMRVQLRNGWYGTMMDNMRGNTRMVDVEGTVRETGSVYAWDIMYFVDHNMSGRPEYVNIEHTPQQLEAKKMNDILWG